MGAAPPLNRPPPMSRRGILDESCGRVRTACGYGVGEHVAWDKNVNEGPLFTMSGTAVRSPLLDRVYVSSPGMGRDAKSRIS